MLAGAAPSPALARSVVGARVEGTMGSVPAVSLLAAIGHVDAAFEMAQAYYFGGPVGPRQAPRPLASAMRATSMLFAPPTAAMRADRRFVALTEALGLPAYWRVAGVVPDHLQRNGG